MSAYYNENDPQAAAWLRELIREGLITWHPMSEPPNTAKNVLIINTSGMILVAHFHGIWRHFYYGLDDDSYTHWADIRGPQT